MSLIKDIASYLVEIGAVDSTPTIYLDFEPEMPDIMIALHEYTGGPVPLFMDTAQRSVQVVVRDRIPANARAKAYEIYNALHAEDKLIHFTEDRFGLVTLRNTPIKTHIDEANRHYYKFNVGITTRIEGMV